MAAEQLCDPALRAGPLLCVADLTGGRPVVVLHCLSCRCTPHIGPDASERQRSLNIGELSMSETDHASTKVVLFWIDQKGRGLLNTTCTQQKSDV